MRVKLLQSVVIGKDHVSVGETVELDDADAQYLIRRGVAEESVEAEKPKGGKRGNKSTAK